MVTACGQACSSLPNYTLRSLSAELYKSPHANVRCALAYIPSLVGVASIWAAVLQKG